MKSTHQKMIAGLGALLLGATLAPNTRAQITELATPADFSGTEQTIDFEGIGMTGDLVPSVEGVTFALAPSGIAPRLNLTDAGPRAFPPLGSGAIDNVNVQFEDLSLTFPSPINRMGFELNTPSGNKIALTLTLAGTPIDSFTFSTLGASAFRFFAFESVDAFDEVFVDVQVAGTNISLWRVDNLRYELSATTTYSCVGFDPPAHVGPITVKNNRVIPLKAKLLREDTTWVTDLDVVAAPALQVIYSPAGSGTPIDVTSESLPAGQGTEGNQFEFSDDRWRYNLKTQHHTAAGTYAVQLISGDSNEYIVDPSCAVDFVVN